MSAIEDFLSGAEGQREQLARTTVSLPAKLLREVEDQALHNKRNNLPNRSVSAIVKAALENTLIS